MAKNTDSDAKKQKLITLLYELFQLDKPELDFGLYKIMHAKSKQISEFLENDLLKEIQQAFGEKDEVDTQTLKNQAQAKLKEALGDEALDEQGQLSEIYANTPAGKRYLDEMATAEAAKETLTAEAEIYDHLYRFFERYYDNGDFMSRRYYARESDSRAAPFSVPYDGREVYLHWANKDQYYIKSSEYLTNYTFELNEAIRQEAQTQKQSKDKGSALDFDEEVTDQLQKVHLRIVSASEGEHGNIKAGNDQKRFFIIHDEPVAIENGELIIQFQYRADPSKTGQDKKWQEGRLDEAETAIIEALNTHDEGKAFLKALQLKAPTDSQKNRTLLGKHLQKYSARNTMDYFIHKDLGGFLRRELDFYIKNEIMRLDDLENAEVPKVEQYLSKIRVLRRIAHQLIAFLAQLEDFQKKLWLKKKFVTETNYCITMDRIPESLYPEIAANEKQRQEWVTLFAINEIEGDLTTPGYSEPLTVEFLKANQFLLIDTALFDENFKAQLLNNIDDLDQQCDGLLIHSENLQALNLTSKTIEKKVSNVFIDPPYNTGDDGFLYKDNYSSSAWLCMLEERILPGINTLSDCGVFFASIGDEEQEHLSVLLRHQYGKNRFFGNLIWEKKKKGSFLSGQIARMKDYILCVSKDHKNFKGLIGEIASDTETYPCVNASNPREIRRIPAGIISKYREENFIKKSGDIISAGNMNLVLQSDLVIENGILAQELIIEGNWRYSQETMTAYSENKELYITQDLYLRRIVSEPRYKRMKDILPRLGAQGESDFRAYDINDLSKYGWGTNEDANDELHQLLGEQYAASYPKPSKLLTLLFSSSRHSSGIWLDYFAGSGSTGHAVLNLNRQDKCRRKYILVEVASYFDTVMKPRMVKAIYAKGWREGKPTSRDSGLSQCFKYLRLESYEDALNNLTLKQDQIRDAALSKNADLQRDYLLNYFLDVETENSQSLLNIADFRDPTAYKMWIKKPGSDEQSLQTIDLIETFNWLLGLWVVHLAAPQTFSADFSREKDKDLPEDNQSRLVCNRLKTDQQGDYWFRLVEGYTLKIPGDDSSKLSTLIIWRKLTDDPEKDNAALQKYLETIGISTREKTYDVIYVNGSHTLPNPVVEGEQTKVRLIEDTFHQAMWSEA